MADTEKKEASRDYVRGIRYNPLQILFENGAIIDFIGFDDQSKIQGGQYDVVFVNEIVREESPEKLSDLWAAISGGGILAQRNNGACTKTEPKEDRLDACPVCGSEVREIGRFYYCLNCEWDDLPQVGK